MNKRLFGVALLAAAGLAASTLSSANAAIVSIGLQQAGVNGGAITTVDTGVGSADFSGAYGSFNVNVSSGSAFPDILLPDVLQTASRDGTLTGGTLTIFITAQGLTSPAGIAGFLSTLTSNTLTNAIAGLGVFLDTAD